MNSTNPIQVVRYEGKPREMGFQQGNQYRTEINQMYHDLTHAPDMASLKPPFLPSKVFLWLARRVSGGMIRRPIQRYLPDQWVFLEGLAEGARCNLNTILFLQAIDAVGTRVSYSIPDTSGLQCSAAGVTGSHSSTGKPLIVKNWDGPEMLARYLVFRHLTPGDSGRYPTIGSGVCALCGINNGMNPMGLCIVYNYAYPKSIGRRGIPPMFLIREALETCTTVDEVTSLIEQFPRLGGAQYLVGDDSGDLAVIETAPDRVFVRRSGEVDALDALVMTNHYRTGKMQELEVPQGAIYGPKTSASMRGQPVHDSSLKRYEAAREVLASASTPVSLGFLHDKVQCNHGSDNTPSDTTFCNHGEIIGTGFGVMGDVAQRSFHAVVGHPCEGSMRQLHAF